MDTGKEGYRKVEINERGIKERKEGGKGWRDKGKEVYRKGGIRDWRDKKE